MGTTQTSEQKEENEEEQKSQSTDFNEFWENFRKSNVLKTATKQGRSVERPPPPPSSPKSPTPASPKFYRKQVDGSLTKAFVLPNGEWLEDSPPPPPPPSTSPKNNEKSSPKFYQKQGDGSLSRHLLLEDGKWFDIGENNENDKTELDTLNKQESLSKIENKIKQGVGGGGSRSRPSKSGSRSRNNNDTPQPNKTNDNILNLKDDFFKEMDHPSSNSGYGGVVVGNGDVGVGYSEEEYSDLSGIGSFDAIQSASSSKEKGKDKFPTLDNDNLISNLKTLESSLLSSSIPQFKPQQSVDQDDMMNPSSPDKKKKKQSNLRVKTTPPTSTPPLMTATASGDKNSTRAIQPGSPRTASPRGVTSSFSTNQMKGEGQKRASSFTNGGTGSTTMMTTMTNDRNNSSNNHVEEANSPRSPLSPLMQRKQEHLLRLKEKENRLLHASGSDLMKADSAENKPSSTMIKQQRNSAPALQMKSTIVVNSQEIQVEKSEQTKYTKQDGGDDDDDGGEVEFAQGGQEGGLSRKIIDQGSSI